MHAEAIDPSVDPHPQAVRADSLPLKWGALCPQCEIIYDIRLECPYCGSHEAISLKKVLGVAE